MEHIGVHEAKTQLSKILHRIEKGEEFAITNRGKVVAHLTAPEPMDEMQKRRKGLDELIALSGTLKLGTMEELMAWKNEGRKG